MINDPYLSEDRCFERLYQDYLKHGKIIVAVDNDGTIFDLHNKGFKFPAVVSLMRECKELAFDIIIFTAAPKERYESISLNLILNNIPFETINKSTIRLTELEGADYSESKVYYNIFLDDRAGLPSAYNILRRLVNTIKENKK